MKNGLRSAVAWGVMAVASLPAAEESFSKAIPAGDFSAAGLAKLSAEELARLDALVRDFKSGALETARREAVAAEAARAHAESRARKAEAQIRVAETDAKKAEPGLLARAKVLLTPGTEIEYTTVESRIAGDFRGWEGRTVFVLENGQQWRADGSSTYVSPLMTRPAVKIVPGVLGSFWMIIEGVRPRVKVSLVGGR
jgi:hypothetical protein